YESVGKDRVRLLELLAKLRGQIKPPHSSRENLRQPEHHRFVVIVRYGGNLARNGGGKINRRTRPVGQDVSLRRRNLVGEEQFRLIVIPIGEGADRCRYIRFADSVLALFTGNNRNWHPVKGAR